MAAALDRGELGRGPGARGRDGGGAGLRSPAQHRHARPAAASSAGLARDRDGRPLGHAPEQRQPGPGSPHPGRADPRRGGVRARAGGSGTLELARRRANRRPRDRCGRECRSRPSRDVASQYRRHRRRRTRLPRRPIPGRHRQRGPGLPRAEPLRALRPRPAAGRGPVRDRRLDPRPRDELQPGPGPALGRTRRARRAGGLPQPDRRLHLRRAHHRNSKTRCASSATGARMPRSWEEKHG